MLKTVRRKLYAAAITPASSVLKRLGLLSGPRFWLPVRMEHMVFRAPLMGGVGFELSGLRYSWKTAVLRDLSEGLFVDVGSHLGETLLDFRFATRKRRYLGFEPLSQCFCYLQTLIRMNDFSEVRVEPCGLSDAAGLAPLYVQGETDAGATFRGGLRPRRRLAVTHAPVFPFDEIRSSLQADAVGFVKIDVEGYELETLRGMATTLEQDRPLVLCEVLFADPRADLEKDGERKQALYEFLAARDYSVFQLQKSRDGRQVASAVRVAAFSVEYWTELNAELCDYLFLPREWEAAALELLHLSG